MLVANASQARCGAAAICVPAQENIMFALAPAEVRSFCPVMTTSSPSISPLVCRPARPAARARRAR